jgi:hypothetical protein
VKIRSTLIRLAKPPRGYGNPLTMSSDATMKSRYWDAGKEKSLREDLKAETAK